MMDLQVGLTAVDELRSDGSGPPRRWNRPVQPSEGKRQGATDDASATNTRVASGGVLRSCAASVASLVASMVAFSAVPFDKSVFRVLRCVLTEVIEARKVAQCPTSAGTCAARLATFDSDCLPAAPFSTFTGSEITLITWRSHSGCAFASHWLPWIACDVS